MQRDVIVIGAGVVGALIACELRAAGLDVLLLDAGPVLPGRERLIENYIRTTTRSPGAPYRAEMLDRVPSMESDFKYAIQANPATPFKSTYERMVGGTTWHWFGLTPRMVPSDFKMKSLYGQGVDWPIGYDDLETWYSAAEEELGVAGDDTEMDGLFGGRRSKPFPMSAVWPSYADELMRARINSMTFEGVTVRVVHTPQARNSRPYKGRPACAGNSSCIPLCPIGAKYDASVHVNRFKDELRGELRPLSVVTRIVAGEGGAIRHVEVTQAIDREKEALSARVYVLAMHAIETPRLMLSSGLCPGNRHVGLYLMDHFNRALVVETAEPTYQFRGPPTTSGIDSLRDGHFRRTSAAFRVSLGNDGGGRTLNNQAIVDDALAKGLYGSRLREHVSHRSTHIYRASCLIEVLPDGANTVTLDETVPRDPLGQLRPRLTFSVGAYERAGLERADQFLAQLMDTVAPGGVKHPQPYAYDGAGHILGTTRMGDGDADSVVDTFGRVHQHKNLFVAGCSVFPTSGTSNPTLTAAALALRLAAELMRELEPMEVRL